MPTVAELLAEAQTHFAAADWQRAEQYCRQALELAPNDSGALVKLSVALASQGKTAEAIACCTRALELDPDNAVVHNNLGALWAGQGNLDEAVRSYQRAVNLQPQFATGHNNLGSALERQGNLLDAIRSYRRAVEIKPDYAEAHNNLGGALTRQGSGVEAMGCYRQALAIRPDFAEAYNNLGSELTRQGRTAEALACYRQAVTIRPSFNVAHSNFLSLLQYQPNITLADLANAHQQFDSQHAAPLRAAWRPHGNARDPERRLRLGFVSADFGEHPVGYFLVRVLENFDPSQAETICYSDRPVADAMTRRLRAAATDWRETLTVPDQALAEMVRQDRIDILFDLTGHVGRTRLLAFARKPAPIQITWMGYVGTTGVGAIDYLLADQHEVPRTAELFIRERVLRMPDGYVCYDPPADAPPVSPLPALGAGQATFGCFNHLAKITPAVIGVWARILVRLTDARLVLKASRLEAAPVRQRIVELFAAGGVDAGRLEFLGWSSHEEVFRQYQRIDVALDPFPYNGGLTTCEALWMGVPVVTCPGETFAGRHALSHLSNVGLTETIAASLDEYVELAVELANDLPRLAAIRADLREQMAASPLCDGARFAANLMQLLRAAWREYTATSG